MTQVTIVVSEHATKPLIHINDLKTVETAVHKLLCMDSLPEPQQKELSNDILYYWQEDMGDNGRHCVQPLVHVLVSERLTALFASMMEEPFMCHVMPAESTPRSMDWILVLHFDAFKRIQDMAFTESRKLLTADASIEKFIHERVVVTKDSVRPNECYAITHDVVRAPLDAPEWKVAKVNYDHQVITVWQANALEKYTTKPIEGKDELDQVIAAVRAAEERINKIGGGENLFKVMPANSAELTLHIVQSTGRDLTKVIDAIKANNMIGFFSQTGDLRYLADIDGHLIDLTSGVGKRIADLSNRTDGSGIETVPGTKVMITHVSRIHPVGSELREEAGALKAAIAHYRTQVDGSNHEATSVNGMWKGSQVTYVYPPYNNLVRSMLNSSQFNVAIDLGLVLMFYRDSGNPFKLILCTDSEGVEVDTSRGIGNEVAKAFGGICGQPIRM